MWAELVVFFAGAVSHKVWRSVWRWRRHPIALSAALSAEFSPPFPEEPDKRRVRTPRAGEVV